MIQKRFENLFIALIFNETECIVVGKVLKDGRIKNTFEKTFEDLDFAEGLDKNLENYLLSLQDEYSFVYISLLLNSLGQGAFSGIDTEDFKQNHVGIHDVLTISIKHQWSIYASLIDIQWAKTLFTNTGLDLIYSPFILLNYFVTSYKLKNKPTCYLLNYQNFFVVAIFEGDVFHVGTFFHIPYEDILDDSVHMMDQWEDQMQEVELQPLDVTELADIIPTAAFEVVEHDEDSSKEHSDEEAIPAAIHKKDLSLELYGRDMLAYQHLKDFLEAYYQNPAYHSEFVEEIVIFDGYEISTELLSHIEEALMMDVEVHQVDVGSSVCDIAIKEVFA